MARFEPIAVNVEEAVVGPVARRDEQDEEEDGAVDAGPVQEIGQEEECHDEAGWVVSVFGISGRISVSWTDSGDALVGMNSKGSQLRWISLLGRKRHAPRAYLRRQNMALVTDRAEAKKLLLSILLRSTRKDTHGVHY